MLNIWNQPSGYSFNTYSERQTQTIPLPLIPGADLTNLTFTIIAGRLPSGLRIVYDNALSTWAIKGSPLEVATNTTSTFVIRAKNTVTQAISDRTFAMTIQGPDAPVWVTEGQDPDIQIYDFDISETYLKDMIVRRTINNQSTLYRVTASTVTGIVPPNSSYYQIFSEPSNLLPVGPVVSRVSRLISAKRSSNLVTVTTATPHNFIFGNIVTIASNLSAINAINVEILQPVPLPGEEYEDYLNRVSNTITYNKLGGNFNSQTITGTVTLIRDPLTFVLDNTLIDFQLQATDSDLSSNDSLEFFIAEGDGELPPGLTLGTNGKITGIIDPILALDITARTGFYDTNLYDAYAYDFGKRPNIGEEDYLNVVTPRKLNRSYEFIVSVSDGESISRRRFRIYVVGDDFLRADNTIVQIGAGTFTADSTYLRAPIWLSSRNLGLRRANNYVTIVLNTFDPNPEIGPVRYELATLNDDLTPSVLPDGLFLDSETSEIFGFAPYQPAITKEYKFTINAIKYDKENITEVEVAIVVADDAPIGQNFLKILPLPLEDVNLLIGDVIRIGPNVYTVTEYISNTVGGTAATLKLSKNLSTNVLDGLIIRKMYNQSVSEFSTQTAPKTFTISILGEVESVIQFITDRNLGSIKPSFPSNFYVEATTTVPNAKLRYQLVDGSLPEGLTLKESGIIEGKINQFRSNSVSGFTLFDSGNTTFDGDTLTIDRTYRFTVNAQDQFRYSSINKEFLITISEGTLTLYSNIYTKPLPKQEKRELFYNFINDTTVFEPNRIYRLGDPSYGIQTELKMLVYPGIESKEIASYISSISKNIRRKRYRIGELKRAIAKQQGSNDIVYEVIYLEILDDYENNGKSASKKIKLSNSINSPVNINQARRNSVDGKLGTYNSETQTVTYENNYVERKLNAQAVDRFSPVSTPITIDTANLNVSGNDLEYVYPSSIKNVRSNISEVGLTENEFLPLWMTTPQDTRTAATGFLKAVPLCYCKPGEGQYILDNIINRDFDFSQLDFEIDRFIIDSDINDVEEKYLKFSNSRYNV